MSNVGNYNDLWLLVPHLNSKMSGITVEAKNFWQGRWFLSYRNGLWSARYLSVFQKMQRYIFGFNIVRVLLPSLFSKYSDTYKNKIAKNISEEGLTCSEISKIQYVAVNFCIMPDRSVAEKYGYFKNDVERISKRALTINGLWSNFSIFGTLGCNIDDAIGEFHNNKNGQSSPKYTLTSPRICANWICLSGAEERYIVAVKTDRNFNDFLSNHGVGLYVDVNDDEKDGSINKDVLKLKTRNVTRLRYNYSNLVKDIVNIIEEIDREQGVGPVVISSQKDFGKGSGLVLAKAFYDAIKKGQINTQDDLYRSMTMWLIEGRLQGGKDFIWDKDVFSLVFKCGEHFLERYHGT